MRIITLLPSATEIVCELGLAGCLVGVTHECDYPASVRGLPKVTKTLIPDDAHSHEIDALVRERLKTERALYSLDLPTLERLRPDLIITQALCDVCAVAEAEVTAAACRLPGDPRVINLEPSSLSDVFECLRLVGDAAGVPERATQVANQLQARVDAVVARSATIAYRPNVVLLEWIDPPFSSGHWSPELVRMAGGVELIGRERQRSRTIAWQEVIDANPDVLVIACCGFNIERTLCDLPVLRSYPGFNELACVQSRNVYVVDGNSFFSRPGPRLVDSLEILAHFLHPQGSPSSNGLPLNPHLARGLTDQELGL